MTDHTVDDRHTAMQALILDTRSFAALLHCAASIRLADHLADGAHTASHIASAENLDIDATERFLRGCVSFGLVDAADGGYRTTPLLDTLRSDDPRSLRDAALAQLGYAHWVGWGRLAEAVRTGQPQLKPVRGQEIFDYFATEEGAAESEAFTRFLAGFNRDLAQHAARVVDTTGVDLAVDVGGAGGSMVMALMSANPNLRGAVLDLEHVAADARREAERQGLLDRFEFITGDFFAEAPVADLYLLKNVLHDWPDDRCDAILSRIRAAAAPGARLIIAETVIDDNAPSQIQTEFDLTMLALAGGRERTIDEFQKLLTRNNFQITAVESAPAPFALIHTTAV
jgi:hypothetical protein